MGSRCSSWQGDLMIKRLLNSSTVTRYSAAVLLLVLSPSVRAADSPSARSALDTIVQREYPSLEEIYLSIHRNPELSLLETRTAAKLAGEFKALGFEVTTGVGGTGIVAILKNGPGKTLLIRTDLDALPVQEETGAPYA